MHMALKVFIILISEHFSAYDHSHALNSMVNTTLTYQQFAPPKVGQSTYSKHEEEEERKINRANSTNIL